MRGLHTKIALLPHLVPKRYLVNLGFEGAIPADTDRPAYHPAILLKIYIYGYLNRIQASQRLEREAQRNVELMRLSKAPEMMRVRKRSVEHPFGTLKQWMGPEMSLNVLAYDMKRGMKIIGAHDLMKALSA